MSNIVLEIKEKKKNVVINESKNKVILIPKEGKGKAIPKKPCKSCGPLYVKPTNEKPTVNQKKNFSKSNNSYYRARTSRMGMFFT